MREAHIDHAVFAKAFRAPNGELAWPRASIIEAINSIQRNGLAISGGEIWAVCDGKVEMQPRLRHGGTAVIAWDTDERQAAESWAQYVSRSASQSLSAIERINAEHVVAPDLKDKLFYNLCYVAAPT